MNSPTTSICTRCVLDTADPNITFDDGGVCNHCRRWGPVLEKLKLQQASGTVLKESMERVRAAGKGKEYDCILGISGGVDSSYVALKAKEYELRPLVVHFDNGWNSELAVENIRLLVDKLGFDLNTFVIDWEEFKDVQRAFFKAGVIDIELVTDHAIIASVFRLAKEHDIRYVLSGTNRATEAGIPDAWVWPKQDKKNLTAIHKRFGQRPLKTFPTLGMVKWLATLKFRPDTYIELLNMIPYSKTQAITELESSIGWRYYGGKHYESVFTKFYQAYVLPTKFGVDKRKAHLSSLIRNGEISRDKALEELKKPLYDEAELRRDKEYVLKKLEFSEDEFDELMKQAPIPHDHYPSDIGILHMARKVNAILGKK